MKVIFDTNILIPAAFRGGKLKIAIAYVLASSSFKWIASSEIIKEYKLLNIVDKAVYPHCSHLHYVWPSSKWSVSQ